MTSKCLMPDINSGLYDSSVIGKGDLINTEYLESNLTSYSNDLHKLHDFFNCIIKDLPEHHATYHTYKQLDTADMNYNGLQVKYTSKGDAEANYSSTLSQLQSATNQLMEIKNAINKDVTIVDNASKQLVNKINKIENKIATPLNKVKKLQSSVETAKAMLSDSQLLYKEQLAGTCILGVLTAVTAISIYINWSSSMKTK